MEQKDIAEIKMALNGYYVSREIYDLEQKEMVKEFERVHLMNEQQNNTLKWIKRIGILILLSLVAQYPEIFHNIRNLF